MAREGQGYPCCQHDMMMMMDSLALARKEEKKNTLNSNLFNSAQQFTEYHILSKGGACGVIVIVVGNEHGDTSSNPGQD